MLTRLDLRERPLTGAELTSALPRAAMDVDEALSRVQPIIAQVRQEGAAALRDLAERFDGVRPTHLRVPIAAIHEAVDSLAPEVRDALERLIAHLRAGHTAQLPEDRATEIMPGGVVRQRWVPVRRVGLYAPGGLAVYPSSVAMNVVAAQVAGVEELAVASPPQQSNGGLPEPVVLAACGLLGIDEVYAVGGAQAVAMFAYGAAASSEEDRAALAGSAGTRTGQLCEPVDVITGPGNIYVAAAKRAVMGTVGIDSEAGTTEIAVIADAHANPAYVATDLISQAEHDPHAASVLITDSVELADAVDTEIAARVPHAAHAERIRQALSGPQSASVLVESIDRAIEVADAYGAEHLEIQTADAAAVAGRIRNAGAIFVGPYSPVPLGDYLAGSNHVLPTGGTARFASGLGVMAFIKSVQQVEYGERALKTLAAPLTALAHSEDLPAHAQSVNARFE
ncbi:histidinol dehydrogenase [Bogoriella caseilytica]|uniref:Histidinol dehydrogenase n=1 Tax=Bogoriella caseilytica TaxID=56055 RepID=A0A3N2BG37_9MICO|nr:histidinol dehydrogenase [Bogoriella caseilytica]ROR74185.1 histidinol dehydrogenase [Bogoriella caseilytica]